MQRVVRLDCLCLGAPLRDVSRITAPCTRVQGQGPTGSKGLHLMARLDRKINHDEARAYAKRIAQRVAGSARNRYTLSSARDKRAGASSSII
jgi:hypothetical protein